MPVYILLSKNKWFSDKLTYITATTSLRKAKRLKSGFENKYDYADIRIKTIKISK